MFVVAQRMWSKARNPVLPSGVCATESEPGPDRSACQRDADGKLRLTSRCARLLVFVGLMTGVLSGMFGVGGGFVIVPALVIVQRHGDSSSRRNVVVRDRLGQHQRSGIAHRWRQ